MKGSAGPFEGDGFKALALFLATLTVGALIAVVGGRVLSAAGGVDGELITQLKEVEGRGFTVELDGGVLKSSKVSYQRLHVTSSDPGAPVVIGTLDFVGTWEVGSESTHVSSVGLERVPFRRDGSDWVPIGGWAPRLIALVQLLDERRRAIEQGAPWPMEAAEDVALWGQMTTRRYTVSGWYARSERDGLDVAEDFRLQGETKDRPVDVKRTKRLRIVERSDGTFGYEARHE